MPAPVATVLYYVLLIFWLAMLVRLIASWVFAFRRSARATGPFAAVLELAYTITDPVLKPIQRRLPALRIGNFAIDVAFIVLIIAVQILMSEIGKYR